MSLRHISLADLALGWSLFSVIVFGVGALIAASAKDWASVNRALAESAAPAGFFAAVMTVLSYAVVKVFS